MKRNENKEDFSLISSSSEFYSSYKLFQDIVNNENQQILTKNPTIMPV